MIEQPLVASQRLVPGRYRIDQTKTTVSLVATHLWGVKPVVASM